MRHFSLKHLCYGWMPWYPNRRSPYGMKKSPKFSKALHWSLAVSKCVRYSLVSSLFYLGSGFHQKSPNLHNKRTKILLKMMTDTFPTDVFTTVLLANKFHCFWSSGYALVFSLPKQVFHSTRGSFCVNSTSNDAVGPLQGPCLQVAFDGASVSMVPSLIDNVPYHLTK